MSPPCNKQRWAQKRKSLTERDLYNKYIVQGFNPELTQKFRIFYTFYKDSLIHKMGNRNAIYREEKYLSHQ